MLAKNRQTPPLSGPQTPKINQTSSRNITKQTPTLQTVYNPSFIKNNQILVPLSSR